jgi:hypothetical protein
MCLRLPLPHGSYLNGVTVTGDAKLLQNLSAIRRANAVIFVRSRPFLTCRLPSKPEEKRAEYAQATGAELVHVLWLSHNLRR